MSDINETIQCAICKETLEDPRPLPCGHSYCGPARNCLKSMENSEGLLVCAICREEHNLKAEDIKPLYGIRDFLQRDDEKLASNELVCSLHQKMECTLWCCDCDIMICGTCLENDHDGHLTRSLKRCLREKVQSKFGSSPLERVSGNLSSVDAFIGKKTPMSPLRKPNLPHWDLSYRQHGVIKRSFQTYSNIWSKKVPPF